MFFKNLISIDYRDVLTIIIVVAILIVVLYLFIVGLSFAFMFHFKGKLTRGKETINLIIFQKYDSLMRVAEILDEFLVKDSLLKQFALNEEFKKYTKLKAEEFDKLYKYTETILTAAQKVYIDNELGDKKALVNDLFLAVSELNTKYLQAVQLYNTNVIGYNYWRDLFSTKWIKNIFFIKKINTIN